MGALISGNKVMIKGCQRVSIVIEHFVKLLLHCGAHADSLTFVNASKEGMENILKEGKETIRQTHFTGSSGVAEHLIHVLDGKVRFEDSGFNWKVLGPDVADVEFVASVADQDAYAAGGQKCSATAMLLMHENWKQTDFLERIKKLASQRNLENLSVSPVMSMTNDQIQSHVDNCLELPGAELLFGGKPLTGHEIPSEYGAYEPTAVNIPFEEIVKPENLDLISTEVFGPF